MKTAKKGHDAEKKKKVENVQNELLASPLYNTTMSSKKFFYLKQQIPIPKPSTFSPPSMISTPHTTTNQPTPGANSPCRLDTAAGSASSLGDRHCGRCAGTASPCTHGGRRSSPRRRGRLARQRPRGAE